jgi:hypothetical protein
LISWFPTSGLVWKITSSACGYNKQVLNPLPPQPTPLRPLELMVRRNIHKAALHQPRATPAIPLGRPTVRMFSCSINGFLVIGPLDRTRHTALGACALAAHRTGPTGRCRTGVLLGLVLFLVLATCERLARWIAIRNLQSKDKSIVTAKLLLSYGSTRKMASFSV